MSKIFLTGMSSQQVSQTANKTSVSFTQVLYSVLTKAGHDVVWAEPTVKMTKQDFDGYDSVIIGFTAPTSVTARWAYGALNVIGELWGDSRLTMLIDTPTPSQIQVSIKSVLKNPSSLTKLFFSSRKEYSEVVSNPELHSKLISHLQTISVDDWGNTIYPSLPWKELGGVKLPVNMKTNLFMVNLDSHLINNSKVEYSEERASKWVYDTKSDWLESNIPFLSLPMIPMKLRKDYSDEQVLWQINRSIGVFISPDKRDGTYWSYRYIQAMNSGIPVATDWKETQHTGDAWNLLPASIEEMSQSKRDLIALSQREAYTANIPVKPEALKNLLSILGIG